MNETEITVECFNSLDEIFRILQKQDFIVKETFELNDFYFSANSIEELKLFDFATKIRNSFLVREIVRGDKATQQLVYKHKKLDNNGNVISEEKTRVKIDNLIDAITIFNKSGLNNWCQVRNKSYVFCNKNENEIEFAIQVIENLGIFIEFEEFDSIKNLSPVEKFNVMKNKIQQFGLSLGNDYSVKKAELLFNKM